MPRKQEDVVVSQSTLVPIGAAIAAVPILIALTVWITRVSYATEANTKNIDRIEAKRDTCLINLKNEMNTLTDQFRLLRQDFANIERKM